MRRLLTILTFVLPALCLCAMRPDSTATAPVIQRIDTGHRVQFAWGAEAGSSIDLSAHDMSSIDFNAGFGLKYRHLSFAGIGVGAHIMVTNSCRSYPVFLALRTGFTEKPHLVFLDLRGGVSLNYLPGNMSQTGPYASVNIGFNLAGNRKFRSYILAGYTLMSRKNINEYDPETGLTDVTQLPSLNYASIRLGVTF